MVKKAANHGQTRRSIFSHSSKELWDALMTNHNKAAVRDCSASYHDITL